MDTGGISARDAGLISPVFCDYWVAGQFHTVVFFF